jgi:hypothetical protein
MPAQRGFESMGIAALNPSYMLNNTQQHAPNKNGRDRSRPFSFASMAALSEAERRRAEAAAARPVRH